MSRSRTSAAEPPAERAALDRAFAAKWEQFARLKRTEDTSSASCAGCAAG